MASAAGSYAIKAVPRPLMFQISGIIGTALFYVAYEAIYAANQVDFHRAGVSWALSYGLSILWQHALHRYLVFGPHGNYVKSLIYCYVCYALSIVLSSLVMDLLVEVMHLEYHHAWIASLVATGAINYLTVSTAFSASEEPKRQD
mmetsp:Transcript_7168/g.22681  ORF Transcript_7168/g.22681 Transcript_7168/m.22681 type:complete len:145 (+) Transcript_7168:1-435(+)